MGSTQTVIAYIAVNQILQITPSLIAHLHVLETSLIMSLIGLIVQNGSSMQPDLKEMLFSSCKYQNNPVLERKVNYTLLCMKYYNNIIYASKLNNSLLSLTDFSNKLNLKYKVENLTHWRLNINYYAPLLLC